MNDTDSQMREGMRELARQGDPLVEPSIATDPGTQAVLDQVAVVETRLEAYVPQKLLSRQEYVTAAEELTRIKAVRKLIEDTRLKLTRPLDETKKGIMDFFRSPAARLDVAEKKTKALLLAYDLEQQRIADEQRRAAQQEADRQRRFEEQRAARLVEQGAIGAAQQAQERAAVTQAPVVTAATPEVSGISYRTVYKFEVEDRAKLPPEYLMVDESKIRSHVDNTKGEIKIPGVRIWSEKIIAAGARRRSQP